MLFSPQINKYSNSWSIGTWRNKQRIIVLKGYTFYGTLFSFLDALWPENPEDGVAAPFFYWNQSDWANLWVLWSWEEGLHWEVWPPEILLLAVLEWWWFWWDLPGFGSGSRWMDKQGWLCVWIWGCVQKCIHKKWMSRERRHFLHAYESFWIICKKSWERVLFDIWSKVRWNFNVILCLWARL